jgi:hypothetical protein
MLISTNILTVVMLSLSLAIGHCYVRYLSLCTYDAYMYVYAKAVYYLSLYTHDVYIYVYVKTVVHQASLKMYTSIVHIVHTCVYACIHRAQMRREVIY